MQISYQEQNTMCLTFTGRSKTLWMPIQRYNVLEKKVAVANSIYMKYEYVLARLWSWSIVMVSEKDSLHQTVTISPPIAILII